MTVDLDKWNKAIEYGKLLGLMLLGQRNELLTSYSDTSEENRLQYLFDTLDHELLYNDVLYSEIQAILDNWLVDDITAKDAVQKLIDLLADYYEFGC